MTNERELRGQVTEVWPQEGYGYVATELGERVRFEREAVRDVFSDLVVGTVVAFVRQDGGDEPQVSSMRILERDEHDLP